MDDGVKTWHNVDLKDDDAILNKEFFSAHVKKSNGMWWFEFNLNLIFFQIGMIMF